MKQLEDLLSAGDLRTVGNAAVIISQVHNQAGFDALFRYLFHPNRVVVMHAADAIEKISISHPHYLAKHKTSVMELLSTAKNIELKWHIALMILHLPLHPNELTTVWNKLMAWLMDTTNSKLVRVAALQAMYELSRQHHSLASAFAQMLPQIEKENIKSLNARVRNLRKEMMKNK